MISLQQERYLWVHFVGLAAVPLLLDICLAGFASADPAFNYPTAFGWQFWAIALLGIVPTLAMQITKPFYIFSLPPIALKPSALTDDQRRCLTVMKSWQIKALAGMTAGFSIWLLSWVYGRSPQILPTMTPTAGLISASVAFFFICLFLQISVSVARAILVSPSALRRVEACEERVIATDFLILGIRVQKLLPPETLIEADAESPDSDAV